MDSYKSAPQRISCDIHTVFAKLSDPASAEAHLRDNLDKVPEQYRDQLDKITFTADGISLSSPMGPVKLALTDKQEPSLVTYEAQGVPLKAAIHVHLTALDDATTQAVTQVDVDLPMMIKAMVGGRLQEVADKLGQLIAMLPYHTA